MKKILIALLLLPTLAFAQDRVEDGMLSMYWFQEGTGSTVNDVAVTPVPVNLTIEDASKVSWVPGGGITINSSTKIASSITPSWLASIGNSGEFSVELWITPSNYTQDGPARIFAYSMDAPTNGGNLVVGQEGASIQGRIRTTVSNVWGSPGVTSGLPSGLVHIVVTRGINKVSTIYLNGSKANEVSDTGTLLNWEEYFFCLANDQDGSRPWLGTIHFAGIFDRALTGTEVSQNFEFGHLPGGPIDIPDPIDPVPVSTNYRWTAPTTGTPAVKYTVQHRTSDNPTWRSYSVVPDTFVTYDGFAGITQWLRVAGIDADDKQGPYSNESDPYTPEAPPTEAPGPPGKPYRVK